ncbi:MAG: DUF4258 domain-containing protein [Candidatus Kapabacteria bacterium]|nr:DUF4258 domain-containing protein [Candidatus Kapabacteria bacterium]
MDKYILSKHAAEQQKVRSIPDEWIQRTMNKPDSIMNEADAHGNTHYICTIIEFGSRKLRVVVNPHTTPNTIVTLFFDRRLR